MSWNVAKQCLFTAALFHPPTRWLDDELEEMAAQCASEANCGVVRQQVSGLAVTLDEREADYARLFLSNPEGSTAHPHGSHWMDGDGSASGTTEEVEARMSHHGVSPRGGRVADSIAAELEFLAWLLDEGAVTDARWLMEHHLLVWTPGFLEALRCAEPHPFYRGASELLTSTLALVQSELTSEQELALAH